MHRKEYVARLERMATPVLEAASHFQLRKEMSIESNGARDREPFAYLEAVGRLLCGMAPWFEVEIADADELALRDKLLGQALLAIQGQVDPASPDYANFAEMTFPCCQLLVDGAFLAEALLRAPNALLNGLSAETREHLRQAMLQLRKIEPPRNNWILFSTEVELLLHELGEEWDAAKIKAAYNQMEEWYTGDGWFCDGDHFAMDYYNSLVIHPMLLDLCARAGQLLPEGAPEKEWKRALRYGEILERMIAPDGSYIIVGRSMAYRCGVFHLLAMLAAEGKLPGSLNPSAVRCALGETIRKTLIPASYRQDGFLAVGVAGAQPRLGESYICTGSLYLASTAFLPLGLSPSDEFWSGPDKPWTQKALWAGEDAPADHAIPD